MLLLCTFGLCGMMTGIIWFVQINHYPLMLKVGAAEFAEYEHMHTKLAGQLIAPIMLAEAALSLALKFFKTTRHLPPFLLLCCSF